ncbi:MAG: methylmalonyl-CoA mutase [Geminicoccaceae bacterium]|nr:methylmalonyl-CoA mutase [Geminicoccaceae bacterium]
MDETGVPGEAEWRAEVARVLKGGGPESLAVRTDDGIGVRALYGPADAAGLHAPPPGEAPFTRGGTPAGGWLIRQRHDFPDPKAANRRILEDLERGVGAIELRLDQSLPEGGDLPDGVMAYDADGLAAALNGLLLDVAPVSLDAGPRFDAMGRALLDLAGGDGRGVSLGADPLGAVALGRMDPDGALDGLPDLARETLERRPAARVARADGEPYHAAGAGEAQELAAVIATATAYLRAFVDGGIAPDDAAGLIEARLAVDADLFLSVAKLRAARRLWSHVLEASGAAPRPLPVTAVTAGRMFTRRDPYVNMLRATVAAMAGGIGGAESVTVLPYDAALGQASAFARRIARNTQLILQEESGLGRVADPAGGAFMVERLTEDLVQAAWPLVQRIEGEGGMLDALRAGLVQDLIGEVFMARLDRIAHRKAPVTGVSTFPNLDEPAPKAPDVPDVAPLVAAARERLGGPAAFAPIEAPLSPLRLAEGFERLRDIADLEAGAGRPPAVFLAGLGPLAEHNERAAFAANAFAAGGIRPVPGPPAADPAAMAAAFRASLCRIACLCGADARYLDEAAAFAGALREAGAEKVYLAGRPLDGADLGADQFLHQGCNLLDLLEDAHSLLKGETP